MQTLRQIRILRAVRRRAVGTERCSSLLQVLAMAVGLPVLVFAGVTIADGLTGAGYIAEALTLLAQAYGER